MKYEIGGQHFRSKRAIEKHVRTIFNRTPVGQFLGGVDLDFMRALLSRHPRATQKIGPGIKGVRVDLNTHWKPQKMFTVVRVDGSETDVSYRSCLYPRSPRQEFAEACRRGILPDVLAFKERVFGDHADASRTVLCPLTGRRIDWHSAHVDHAPPWTFRNILDEFLAAENLDPAAVDLGGDEDGQVQYYLADAELRECFCRFHNERANLRVVAKEANLSLAKFEARERKDTV